MSQPLPNLPIRCACGAFHGLLRAASSEAGNRCVCYCDDCQTFAHYLARAEEILDPNGGTEIFQTTQGRLEITQGVENLVCVRLGESGMFRWHTRCCRTAIGNTPGTIRVPFVGLIFDCIDHVASDGRSREATLGPIRMRGFARFAKGDRSPLDAHDGAPAEMGIRVTELIQEALARGEQDRPVFFNVDTGDSIVAPRVLRPEELRAAESARDAAG